MRSTPFSGRRAIPYKAEQARIAAVLQVVDQEIDIIKRYLDGLGFQKKGLMQRLLTGQVRVHLDEELHP